MDPACRKSGWGDQVVYLLQEQQAFYHGDAHPRSGKCWSVAIPVVANHHFKSLKPWVVPPLGSWDWLHFSLFLSSLFKMAVTLTLMLRSIFCLIPRRLPRGKLKSLAKPATRLTMKWYAPALVALVRENRDVIRNCRLKPRTGRNKWRETGRGADWLGSKSHLLGINPRMACITVACQWQKRCKILFYWL